MNIDKESIEKYLTMFLTIVLIVVLDRIINVGSNENNKKFIYAAIIFLISAYINNQIFIYPAIVFLIYGYIK
jgi:hypothetical protein